MLLFLAAAPAARASNLEPHSVVRGPEVTTASVRAAGGTWHPTPWDDLDQTQVDPGRYQVRFGARGEQEGDGLEVPHCAGRERVTVDGRDLSPPPGPLVLPLAPGPHEVVIEVVVSPYERRIACGDRPRFGPAVGAPDGLGVLTFPSPWSKKGGGRAVVYVPPRHDVRVPGPVLVGLHPWNGSMWTYAAYAQLLREARARDLVLLMPCGLGNSLYTADAEDEVMRAITAVAEVLAVDGRAVSLWGASMGGAGATTIGFHRPDQFASVTSFFGDSKYDLTSYARSILPNDATAHLVNALDVVENARELSVWLIHGEDDRTSPIRQSEMLAARMQERGMRVRFDRVPGAGHSGALVARFLPALVTFAVSARAPEHVSHVTYRSVRASDTQAYGVRITRAAPRGDAFVDIERRDDAVHVRRAAGVSALALSPGALGTPAESPPPIVVDDAAAGSLDARWEP
ncbi:MAG TPA: prolyl oligopeptidase family serine peptidase [Polyangiaceae bacterium]|nr:prolyl oligopeptidase family serine peptidase [Polyangiaceae bacterium]